MCTSQGGGEARIWFLTLTADNDYPVKAPTIRFTSKIAGCDAVDARGNVSVDAASGADATLVAHAPAAPRAAAPVPAQPASLPPLTPALLLPARRPRPQVIASRVPYLASWNPSKTMMGALNEIKAVIMRAPRAQPADGTTF